MTRVPRGKETPERTGMTGRMLMSLRISCTILFMEGDG